MVAGANQGEASRIARPSSTRSRTGTAILQAVAGLIGASGVGLAAAAAHHGGGGLTSIAATFAILHAGAILALTALIPVSGPRASGLVLAALGMAAGTILFSGDLAMAGLLDAHPWPAAAPIGGSVLILSWLCVTGSALIRGLR